MSHRRHYCCLGVLGRGTISIFTQYIYNERDTRLTVCGGDQRFVVKYLPFSYPVAVPYHTVPGPSTGGRLSRAVRGAAFSFLFPRTDAGSGQCASSSLPNLQRCALRSISSNSGTARRSRFGSFRAPSRRDVSDLAPTGAAAGVDPTSDPDPARRGTPTPAPPPLAWVPSPEERCCCCCRRRPGPGPPSALQNASATRPRATLAAAAAAAAGRSMLPTALRLVVADDMCGLIGGGSPCPLRPPAADVAWPYGLKACPRGKPAFLQVGHKARGWARQAAM